MENENNVNVMEIEFKTRLYDEDNEWTLNECIGIKDDGVLVALLKDLQEQLTEKKAELEEKTDKDNIASYLKGLGNSDKLTVINEYTENNGRNQLYDNLGDALENEDWTLQQTAEYFADNAPDMNSNYWEVNADDVWGYREVDDYLDMNDLSWEDVAEDFIDLEWGYDSLDEYADEIEELEMEVHNLTLVIERLKEEVEEPSNNDSEALKTENETLKAENEALKQELAELKEKLEKLKALFN